MADQMVSKETTKDWLKRVKNQPTKTYSNFLIINIL